ncbi:MAG: polysaccharide biosynthesis protein [Acidobacteria bacterium]|nr:polysaccharide biosynthesis protein [Acidobacteriota bacterium]MCB9396218.1 polysaccharide biosynthesis protein [Acidobacteriota bacterium]
MEILLNRYVILVIDLMFTALALFLAYFVRSEFHWPFRNDHFFYSSWPFFITIQPLIFYLMGTHRLIITRITFEDSVRLLSAIALGTLLLFVVVYSAHGFSYPRSIFILFPLILSSEVISLRYFGRYFYERRKRARRSLKPASSVLDAKRILIIGAGHSGIQLVRALLHHPSYKLVGFVDDDPGLAGKQLFGLSILGKVHEAAEMVAQYKVDEVLFAIPSADGSFVRQTLKDLRPLKVPVRILPRMLDSLDIKNPTTQLRSVKLEDLLRRSPVDLDLTQIKSLLAGKRILITGAAGSIGSEVCRQILHFHPEKLVLVDMAESPLYEIDRELSEYGTETQIHACLADITHQANLQHLFEVHQPEVVFHAAAYKHVPMLEHHPFIGILNNLAGGKNVADLACQYKCEKVVLISTDKAVNPTNLMGMTKRALEHYFRFKGQDSSTHFSIVRFGNVLGSQGSLIPTFERQLRKGGPLTVTHPEITRFFMTIPEATQLVLQAGAMGQGGEIFVLDMGESVRIYDLARDFIELSGFEVDNDIAIQITGLRPGEKLFEELFAQGEKEVSTQHPKIRRALGDQLPTQIEFLFSQTIQLALQTDRHAFQKLIEMVPEATWSPNQDVMSLAQQA